MNAFDLGGTAKSLDGWGYPRAWRFVTAILEVAGAVMLFEPQTREADLVLLGLVIIGALLTLLRARAEWRHPEPAIGFGLLLVAHFILGNHASRGELFRSRFLSLSSATRSRLPG